jgi:putative inorganic carbon (HCO3(-)) transporter
MAHARRSGIMSSLLKQADLEGVDSRRLSGALVVMLVIAGAASLLLALVAHGPVVVLGVALAAGTAVLLVTRVEVAALVFVAVAPFEGYAKSVNGSAVKVLGGVLFLAWLYRLMTRRSRAPLRHPVVYATAALLAVLMASTVLHQNSTAGTQVLIRYVSYLMALVVLVDCMQDRLTPRLAAQVYVAAASVAACFGLVQYFGNSLRAGATVGDPNDFAFFLLAALALCAGLRGDGLNRLYDLAALLLGLGILATLSRGALAGFGAMLVFAVATHQIRLRVLVGTAALAGVAVLGILLADPTKVTDSLHAKGQVAQQNVGERLLRWEAAAEMTYDHPVLGLGPAGFRQNYDRQIDYRQTDVIHILDVAHETYLEVASELGLPGLVAFVAVLGFGFRGAWRSARGQGDDARLARSVCLALVGTSVAAIFLTEQYYLPLWLLAALGAALEGRASRAEAG